MLDEPRYQEIREQLSAEPIMAEMQLSGLAAVMDHKTVLQMAIERKLAEQAQAQSKSKPPLSQFFRNKELHRKQSKPPRS